MCGYRWLVIFLSAALVALAAPPQTAARAETYEVSASQGDLASLLLSAQAGDIVKLAPGLYHGPIEIDRPLQLLGAPGAVIDGGGQGNVITISAPDVVLSGLTIRNSGRALDEQNSGVFVGKGGHRARIEKNRLENNLIGVYLWGPNDALVANNDITGITDMRVNERGNGIQLWRTPGSVVTDNVIRHGRDGIFVTTSKRNIFRNNHFEETRFAIHYMYTNDSEIVGNVSIGNDMGYALMYSKNLKVRGNVSLGDRDHGIALNFANRSIFEDNYVKDVKGKCVFIYNSNKNIFRRNHFQGCGIGVHFTAGSEGNTLSGNAFIQNRTQVKYVGTRWLDWAEGGRGNYWSDNPAFDLDGDGIADTAYRPNDMIDRIVWAVPSAKLLLSSPAVTILRWAQAEFPAIRPGGVTDSAPLMAPITRKPGPRTHLTAKEINRWRTVSDLRM